MRISDWSSDVCSSDLEKGPTRASTLLFLCGCYIRRNHLFVRIDRLRRLNYDDVNQHRIDVRDRIDVIDLAIAELEPGKPDEVQVIAGGLHAHKRYAGVFTMVVTRHADFVLAPAQRPRGSHDARGAGLGQAPRTCFQSRVWD